MKYKIIRPWLDTDTQELHATIGEIVEMDDRERAERLIRAGAFEEVKEAEKAEEVEEAEEEPKPKKEEKAEPETSSRKRK